MGLETRSSSKRIQPVTARELLGGRTITEPSSLSIADAPITVRTEKKGSATKFFAEMGTGFKDNDFLSLLHEVAPSDRRDTRFGVYNDWVMPDRGDPESRDLLRRHQGLRGWTEFEKHRWGFVRAIEYPPEKIEWGKMLSKPEVGLRRLGRRAASVIGLARKSTTDDYIGVATHGVGGKDSQFVREKEGYTLTPIEPAESHMKDFVVATDTYRGVGHFSPADFYTITVPEFKAMYQRSAALLRIDPESVEKNYGDLVPVMQWRRKRNGKREWIFEIPEEEIEGSEGKKDTLVGLLVVRYFRPERAKEWPEAGPLPDEEKDQAIGPAQVPVDVIRKRNGLLRISPLLTALEAHVEQHLE